MAEIGNVIKLECSVTYGINHIKIKNLTISYSKLFLEITNLLKTF
jgi:hypothetical protein